MRAILSDLDGTLLDSSVAIDRVWGAWLRENAITLPATGHPHGMPARGVIELLAPHLDADAGGAEVTRRELVELGGVVALPGAAALLADPPGGAALAVVTSCTRPLALARMGAAGLALAPGVGLVTAERTPRGKPDPAPYLLAAAELGVAPGDCVVLEDAPAGIIAGRAAGMHVVGVGPFAEGADERWPDVGAWAASHRRPPPPPPPPR